MAVVIRASRNACGQSAKAKLVAINNDVVSDSLLIRWNSHWLAG
jgi:hypothetical protein